MFFHILVAWVALVVKHWTLVLKVLGLNLIGNAIAFCSSYQKQINGTWMCCSDW